MKKILAVLTVLALLLAALPALAEETGSLPYAEEHPEVVEAVAEAWYKAIDFLEENPEEACELMAGGFEEVTAEDIAADMEGLVFFGREDNEELNNEENERSIFAISQDMADFWMEKGECDTDDLTDFFSLVK